RTRSGRITAGQPGLRLLSDWPAVHKPHYGPRRSRVSTRPQIANAKPTTNGASVISKCPETWVASTTITGTAREIKGSNAAQKAHASPRRNGKKAMRISTPDKLTIARAPATKCLPVRVATSGRVFKIAYAANADNA